MLPIPYGRHEITDEDIASMTAALRSDFPTQGPAVEVFEKSLAEAVGASHAVAVTNGTAALHLCAMALGVQPGHRVLVTANTFAASANCIRYCGGDVEFLDIDPLTLCSGAEQIEKKLRSAPKGTYQGVVVVDFAGYPVDLRKVRALADEFGMWIIEDACHAIGGAITHGPSASRCGSGQYADLAIFSFHPVKHIAAGEGGAITTRNADLYQKVKRLRTHGITKDPSEFRMEPDGPWYYEMQELGYNYRIPDVLCALAGSQLKRLLANISRRQEIARIYRQELKDVPLRFTPEMEGVSHAYHLMVGRTSRRNELFQHLREKSIYPQLHYIPVYRQPYYEALYGKQRLPETEAYYSEALSLPMYHSLTDSQLDYVIREIREFFRART